MEMAEQLGDRLAHVHLADGTKPGLPDEHLVPGRGSQPCAQLLARLRSAGYGGMVVLEVSTRRVATRDERQADLAESLAFARRYLSGDEIPGDETAGDETAGDETAGDETAGNETAGVKRR
jgi:sugar phosphate isomerase/epimerase